MNTLSRQVRRQIARLKKKFDHKLAVGSVDASGKSRLPMNGYRDTILRRMHEAIANSYEPPATVELTDRLTYPAEQRMLAWKLNAEYMGRSNGRGGKKPHGVFAVQSIANRVDRTNPIGHFS